MSYPSADDGSVYISFKLAAVVVVEVLRLEGDLVLDNRRRCSLWFPPLSMETRRKSFSVCSVINFPPINIIKYVQKISGISSKLRASINVYLKDFFVSLCMDSSFQDQSASRSSCHRYCTSSLERLAQLGSLFNVNCKCELQDVYDFPKSLISLLYFTLD